MKETVLPFTQGLPWEETPDSFEPVSDYPEMSGCSGCPAADNPDIGAVSRLLDRMVMDIQHLEIELVRTRYRLSFFLENPYDEYMRMELFSGMGGRYGGDPVYDRYLRYRGFSGDEDAIDTPFHVARMMRLSDGHDDYPYLYP